MQQTLDLAMSEYFKVVANAGEYSIQIGRGVFDSKISQSARQIIICDQFFALTYLARGLNVISIVADESAKSLDQIDQVIIALRTLGANRSTSILAIGGGVMQDIATFVASIYMRGLKWDYFPTTLLGMVDSCIGGKSSINVGKYKNLIGNFYPPENIYIDLKFIETLNAEQRISGLFEAVKICFAHTGDAFENYITLTPSAESAVDKFHDVISLSLRTKRWFIEIDEHDLKERLLLNYGHTFGHAIEGACNFVIPHGIAVGMGMLAAIQCARLNGHFGVAPPRVLLLERYVTTLLATLKDLPNWRGQITANELLDRFSADKKHNSTHYCVIVPDAEGYLMRLELEKNDINREMILSAFRSVFAEEFT